MFSKKTSTLQNKVIGILSHNHSANTTAIATKLGLPSAAAASILRGLEKRGMVKESKEKGIIWTQSFSK
jgi:DNA-binding MarR family transcriptional regulator